MGSSDSKPAAAVATVAVEVPDYWQTEVLNETTVLAIEAEGDYYRLLGVSRKATTSEIRHAYLSLIKVNHPDRSGNCRVATKLNAAYETLRDARERQQYDNDRAGFLKRKILYAKNVGAEVLESVSSGFSHYVEVSELNLGDHVYYYMSGCKRALQHHGIVSKLGDDAHDVWIIDFGMGGEQKSGRKLVREVKLAAFLPHDRYLRRAQYGETYLQATFKLVASYKDVADPPTLVLQRARRLLMLENMEYDLFVQSCETVAFWCKTGKRYSNQATKAARVLGGAAGALVVTSGSAILSTTLTTGFFVTEESAVAAAVEKTIALTGNGVGSIAVGSVAAFVCLTFGGFLIWRSVSRALLARSQPLEVINVITMLESRDRRAYSRDTTYDKSECVAGLAQWLDDMALGRSRWFDDDPVSPEELVDIVRRKLELAAEEYFTGRNADMNADDLVPFVVQVLSRCEAFNAALDLPDMDPADFGPNNYYLVTLKAGELELLRLRHFAFNDDVVVNTAVQKAGMVKWPPLDVKMWLQRDGVERPIVARKHLRDISPLHKILCELHPDIRNLEVPRKTESNTFNRGDIPALSEQYLRSLVMHSKFPHDSGAGDGENFYMLSYLKALQATEVSEQLAAFLDPNLLCHINAAPVVAAPEGP